jgi:hypothetical protein
LQPDPARLSVGAVPHKCPKRLGVP